MEEFLRLRNGENIQIICDLEIGPTYSPVPVILVLTKYDMVISDFLSKIAGADAQQYELARARAHQMCEEFRRHHFHKGLQEVPVEIVSGTPLSSSPYAS